MKKPGLPRSTRHLLCAAALIPTLAGAANGPSLEMQDAIGRAAPAMAAAASPVISDEQEVALGRELAGRLLGGAPLVDDAHVQVYINRVGRAIASHSKRPELPWRFGVVESPAVNAYSAPGGYVFVARGLYEVLENEAQLAGALAQAIASIARRQHIDTVRQASGIAAMTAMSQFYLAGRSAAQADFLGRGNEIFIAGVYRSAIFDADADAVELAARAGYNPFGMVDVLHKLEARRGPPAASDLTETHPHPSERLEELGARLIPRLAELPVGTEPAIRRLGPR